MRSVGGAMGLLLVVAVCLAAGCDGNGPEEMLCGIGTMPEDGDRCSAADRDGRIACRGCSCSSGCCEQCVCGTDMRWSCYPSVCRDSPPDGGSCDLGVPPRCLAACAGP